MLAVMDEQRSPLFPNVPTMKEQGFPGLVVQTWYGMLAPAGTPAEVIARMNAEVNAAVADAEVRQKAEAAGLQLRGGTPAQFSAFMEAETRKWSQIIQVAHITAE